MDITYFGHSSFKLRGRTASVITDPFDPQDVGLKFAKQSADIVTVSHEHSDHNFVENVKDLKKVVNGPGEYEIMGVSIVGIQTYHDDEKGVIRGKNTVYVFEMDNMRICHLGDLGHKMDDKQMEEIGEIDVLLVPVGGKYTIDSTQALEIVRAIEPNITIPMHYQVPGLNADKYGELEAVDNFTNEIGMTVERLPKLSIKKGELDVEKKVVVLEARQ
jgi:L-ascorbate metabolism protein UlaG (beta-lactamase superfamily)